MYRFSLHTRPSTKHHAVCAASAVIPVQLSPRRQSHLLVALLSPAPVERAKLSPARVRAGFEVLLPRDERRRRERGWEVGVRARVVSEREVRGGGRGDGGGRAVRQERLLSAKRKRRGRSDRFTHDREMVTLTTCSGGATERSSLCLYNNEVCEHQHFAPAQRGRRRERPRRTIARQSPETRRSLRRRRCCSRTCPAGRAGGAKCTGRRSRQVRLGSCLQERDQVSTGSSKE